METLLVLISIDITDKQNTQRPFWPWRKRNIRCDIIKHCIQWTQDFIWTERIYTIEKKEPITKFLANSKFFFEKSLEIRMFKISGNNLINTLRILVTDLSIENRVSFSKRTKALLFAFKRQIKNSLVLLQVGFYLFKILYLLLPQRSMYGKM